MKKLRFRLNIVAAAILLVLGFPIVFSLACYFDGWAMALADLRVLPGVVWSYFITGEPC